ncbi:hypothetical protein [Propionivibrio sp.]|uniref:hypothetical protein n=1 Tax=Propionivibrio sp. TaxID=2212460 RepID=UPI003BF29B25
MIESKTIDKECFFACKSTFSTPVGVIEISTGAASEHVVVLNWPPESADDSL